MNWIAAAGVAEFDDTFAHLLRDGNKQIAVMKFEDGFYAMDNRCPHEGYPLIQGSVKDCVLTCNWHNWKFDLADGKCLVGADNVRSYPTKVEEETVFVDVSDPSNEEVLATVLEGLKIGFEKRQTGRIYRELARLHFNEIDPMLVLPHALEWYHTKLEYGFTHAVAAATDWIQLYDKQEESIEDQLICLGEVIDHLAYDVLRFPEYPYPEDVKDWDRNGFLNAMEIENETDAIAFLRGALQSKLPYAEIEEALTTAALAHYQDFGHSLIFVYKTGQLLQRLGPDFDAGILLLPLVRSLIYANREDLIPEFSEYADKLAQWPAEQGNRQEAIPAEALHLQSVNQCMNWVLQQATQSSYASIFDTLLHSTGHSVSGFDASWDQRFDQSPDENRNIISATHEITFANAVHVMCDRYPELWSKGLLQIACFIGRNAKFMNPEADSQEWQVHDKDAFLADSLQIISDHGNVLPIYPAHYIKTFYAVCDESETASDTTSAALFAGLNCFLHGSIKTKHVRRLVRQGVKLIARDFAKE